MRYSFAAAGLALLWLGAAIGAPVPQPPHDGNGGGNQKEEPKLPQLDCVYFTRDGSKVFGVENDPRAGKFAVHSIDPKTGELKVSTPAAVPMLVSPDGFIAIPGPNGLIFRSPIAAGPISKIEVAPLPGGQKARELRITGGGTHALVLGEGLFLYDLRGPRRPVEFPRPDKTEPVQGFAPTPKGDVYVATRTTLYKWSPGTNTVVKVAEVNPAKGVVKSRVSLSQDGKHVAFLADYGGLDDGRLMLVDTAKDKVLSTLPVSKKVSQVEFLEGSNQLAWLEKGRLSLTPLADALKEGKLDTKTASIVTEKVAFPYCFSVSPKTQQLAWTGEKKPGIADLAEIPFPKGGGPNVKDFFAHWGTLADERVPVAARRAFLMGDKAAGDFLRGRIVDKNEDAKLAKLVKDLGDDDFETREKASETLAKDFVDALLKGEDKLVERLRRYATDALYSSDPEVSNRGRLLLKDPMNVPEDKQWPFAEPLEGEDLRRERVIEMLKARGTPADVALLREAAAGAPGISRWLALRAIRELTADR